MAFNGSGVHNRVHDWTQDLTTTIPVTASRMDAEHDDISSSLSNMICRDGQSTTTARIPFASGVSCAAGSTASASYAQTNDPNTGMYFPATDQWGLVAGGTATLVSTATKLTASVAMDFMGAVAPTSDDGAALGSTSQRWSDLFLAPGAVISFNSGNATITHSTNTLTVAVTTFAVSGAATVSGGLTAGAMTASTGLTVSAGGFGVTGNSTITGTLTVSSTLTASSGFTVSGGTVTLPAGSIETADIADSNVTLGKLAATAKAFEAGLLHARDEKANGTAAGSFSAGSWVARTLNTVVTNEITGASLGSNQITLPAGTYHAVASAPTFGAGTHKLRLRNVSESSDTLIGQNATDGDLNLGTTAHLRGRFTIAAEKTFELQHQCQTGQATEGLGRAAGFGVVEVYADVMIWKVA